MFSASNWQQKKLYNSAFIYQGNGQDAGNLGVLHVEGSKASEDFCIAYNSRTRLPSDLDKTVSTSIFRSFSSKTRWMVLWTRSLRYCPWINIFILVCCCAVTFRVIPIFVSLLDVWTAVIIVFYVLQYRAVNIPYSRIACIRFLRIYRLLTSFTCMYQCIPKHMSTSTL